MSGRRWMCVAVAVLAMLTAMTACVAAWRDAATPSPLKLVFVTGGSGAYWQAAADGAKAAASQRGVDLQIELPADGDFEQQLAVLEGVDGGGTSGIALSVMSSDVVAAAERLSRTTNVLTWGAPDAVPQRLCHVDIGPYVAARMCAQAVQDASPSGKIAVIYVEGDHKRAGREQLRTFLAAHQTGDATDSHEIVECPLGNGDDYEERVKTLLLQHPDLVCGVHLDSTHGDVLVKALDAAGALGKVKLITFDQSAAMVDRIATGEVHAVIGPDPYDLGYEAVARLAALCRCGPLGLPAPGRASVYVAARVMRRESLGEFRARLALAGG